MFSMEEVLKSFMEPSSESAFLEKFDELQIVNKTERQPGL
jgi:hypothetical protein